MVRTLICRVTLGCALVASAAGCDWTMVRGDAARTGNAYETAIGVGNVAELAPAWTAAAGAGLADGPVTAAGAIVVLSADHLLAYEIGTGVPRFDLTLPGFPFPEFGTRQFTGLSVKGAVAYVGFGDPLTSGGSHGGFLTVDVATGTVTGGDGGGGSFVPTSAAAFVGGDTWYAYGLAAPLAGGGFAGIRGVLADGRTIATVTNVGGSGLASGPPVVADGVAYAVRPGGTFIDAIDATLSGGCETYLGTGCDPLWSAPITGSAALAASGPSLYATNAAGVAAYATGPGVSGPDRQPAWTAAVPGASAPALTPAADATALLVGADDGLLRAYPADGCGAPTCAPTWTATLGGDLGAPVVANGIAFVASSDGHAYALPASGCGASTCAPLWSGTVPGTPQSVIVARGHLVVRTTTGTLAAYALPAG